MQWVDEIKWNAWIDEMSGSNERNNENYKNRNENEINRPILVMSEYNLNT